MTFDSTKRYPIIGLLYDVTFYEVEVKDMRGRVTTTFWTPDPHALCSAPESFPRKTGRKKTFGMQVLKEYDGE
jgi:hypothetical protein